MPRSTERIKFLVEGAAAMRQAIREEIAQGVSFQPIYDQFVELEQTFRSRLKDLEEFNRIEAAKAPQQVPERAPIQPPPPSAPPPSAVVPESAGRDLPAADKAPAATHPKPAKK